MGKEEGVARARREASMVSVVSRGGSGESGKKIGVDTGGGDMRLGWD